MKQAHAIDRPLEGPCAGTVSDLVNKPRASGHYGLRRRARDGGTLVSRPTPRAFVFCPMKFPRPTFILIVACGHAGLLHSTSHLAGHSAPRPAATAETPIVQWDEFQVSSDRDPTYRATNATAGTRHGTKIKDLPQSIPPAPAGAIIQNGAEQADGTEVHFTAELARGLTLIGSYAYLDAFVKKGQNNIADGKPLQNAPRHSGQLWVRYAFQRGLLQGLGVRLDIRRSSEIFGRVNQNVKLPGYTLMNAGTSYRWKRQLSLQINVSNLADHDYYRAAGASAQIALGAPRNWMFSSNYNF